MRLPHAFYTFPFRFDVERMRQEIDAIPEEHWRWHPEGFEGNSALPLISTNGGVNDDFIAPMKRTEFLDRMPYVNQVLSQFRTLHGRARLMRIEPHAGVPLHVDIQYYWRTHTRVHIPVVTNPDIRFYCANEVVHMAAGEAWTFDNWRRHRVVNDTDTRRIHLTFDTYGSTAFWGMARPRGAPGPAPAFVPYDPNANPQLVLEAVPDPLVMSPSELELEFTRIMQDLASHPNANHPVLGHLSSLLYALQTEWKMLWYARGSGEQDVPVYTALLRKASQDIFAMLPKDMEMGSNRWPADKVLGSIFAAMVPTPKQLDVPTAKAPRARFDRPVFVVSAPRSGSTLLFETLAASEHLWTLGGEGHRHLESIAPLAPMNRGFDSNRLTTIDATDSVSRQLRANYLYNLVDASGRHLRDLGSDAPEAVRFLEKTPKNALRIPFLKSIFPDAKFIFLNRDAPANIASIMEAWRAGSFVTYPNLDGWQGLPWSLLLIPGWRELIGADLARIALRQWQTTNATILDDLAVLAPEDWCAVRYEDFVADTSKTLERLSTFIGVPYGNGLHVKATAPLKHSVYTVTPPERDKWLREEAAIRPLLAETSALAGRLQDLNSQRAAAQ